MSKPCLDARQGRARQNVVFGYPVPTLDTEENFAVFKVVAGETGSASRPGEASSSPLCEPFGVAVPLGARVHTGAILTLPRRWKILGDGEEGGREERLAEGCPWEFLLDDNEEDTLWA